MELELPRTPGRARMLAYGEYVRERNRARPQIHREYFHFQDGLTLRELIDCSRVCICGRHVFCCICQETVQTNDILRRLKCHHEYHLDCIDAWFVDNNICPLCMKSMKQAI
jgi:hypothetical protein